MNKNKRLHEILPREQAGSRTAQQFDYQYCQVANECFGLFESSGKLCVFCEWHDDFVTEHKESSLVDIYAFNQVKTKATKSGPWKLSEIFGAGGKTKILNKDSAFFRMFQNYLVFEKQCRKFIFITNSSGDTELEKFIQEIAKSNSSSSLTGEVKDQFHKIWEKYQPEFKNGNQDLFFELIKKFELCAEAGTLGDHVSLLRTKIGDHISNFCEIDLKTSETKRITDNIVDLVRKRSQHQIKKLPIAEDELQKSKAITAEDVLSFLPLSKDGLKVLQSGACDIKNNLLTLSRLHRLCQQNNIPENLIQSICDFKVKWDLWLQDKKLDIDKVDIESIKIECLTVLSASDKSFKAFGEGATEIVKKFNPKLPNHLQLTNELVLGFIFSLASQMESASNE